MQTHYEITVEFEYLKDVKYDELKAIVAQQPVIRISWNIGLEFSKTGSVSLIIYKSINIKYHIIVLLFCIE